MLSLFVKGSKVQWHHYPSMCWRGSRFSSRGNDKVRTLFVPSEWNANHDSWMLVLQVCLCMQVNLALCCKAMLPVLYKGFVSVGLDKPKAREALTST